MQFRRAKNSDLNALVDLQSKYSLVGNANLDRRDGFLSSSFTAEDFAAINKDLAVVVCTEDDDQGLLGFVCCSTVEFNQRLGLPRAMIARFAQVRLDGRLLKDWSCVIAGPVCVEKARRGSGVFADLYLTLWSLLPAQYEVAVALVSAVNPRSLAAHKKIGMVEVDQFVYNDKTYNTIAMKLDQPDIRDHRAD